MNVPTDERLGLIQPLSWLVTNNPYLSAFLMFLVTPGGVYIARAIGGRVLLPSDEFSSFRANKVFPLILACNVAIINSAADKVIVSNWFWTGMQITFLLLWATIGLLHRRSETHLMSRGQRLSLTSLYHDFAVYALAGPVLTCTTIYSLVFGSWSFAYVVLRVIVVLCLLHYASGVLDDIKNGDRLTHDGMTLLQVAHTDHSLPWQWAKRDGHVQWWWNRYKRRALEEGIIFGMLRITRER